MNSNVSGAGEDAAAVQKKSRAELMVPCSTHYWQLANLNWQLASKLHGNFLATCQLEVATCQQLELATCQLELATCQQLELATCQQLELTTCQRPELATCQLEVATCQQLELATCQPDM